MSNVRDVRLNGIPRTEGLVGPGWCRPGEGVGGGNQSNARDVRLNRIPRTAGVGGAGVGQAGTSLAVNLLTQSEMSDQQQNGVH